MAKSIKLERFQGEEWAWKEEGASDLATFDDVSLSAGFFVWLASAEACFLKG
jgi:hypothetical protein